MDNDPYRPEPNRDAELEKLAAKGRQRIANEAKHDAVTERSEEETRRDTNLRAALGAYYGTPQRALGLALIIAFPVALIATIGTAFLQGESPAKYAALAAALKPLDGFGWIVPIILIVSLPAGIILRTVVPPRASPKRVAAEREWARSLPIGFDDAAYFEVLASEPVLECRVELDIEVKDRLPAIDILEGIVGVVDAKARVVSSGGNVARIRSGPISGDTGVSVSSNGSPSSSILRNDKIVAYVHDFVDKVLLPLHESSPIARVTFPRPG